MHEHTIITYNNGMWVDPPDTYGIERTFQSIKIVVWGFIRFGYNAKGETIRIGTITLSWSCDLLESWAIHRYDIECLETQRSRLH